MFDQTNQLLIGVLSKSSFCVVLCCVFSLANTNLHVARYFIMSNLKSEPLAWHLHFIAVESRKLSKLCLCMRDFSISCYTCNSKILDGFISNCAHLFVTLIPSRSFKLIKVNRAFSLKNKTATFRTKPLITRDSIERNPAFNFK